MLEIAEASENLSDIRRKALKIGLAEKLTDAQKKIEEAEDAVGTKLEDGQAKLEELYELWEELSS